MVAYLNEKHEVKLAIKLYSDFGELMYKDRLVYNKFTKWINNKVEEFVSEIVEALERVLLGVLPNK